MPTSEPELESGIVALKARQLIPLPLDAEDLILAAKSWIWIRTPTSIMKS